MTGTDEVRIVLAAEAGALARALGVRDEDRQRLAPLLPLLAASGTPPTGPGETSGTEGSGDPGDPVDPGILGRRHESLLDAGHRHRRGVHYTPSTVAALLVALALDGRPDTVSAPLVCDPSCGGGAFLLAAAEHLAGDGLTPAAAVSAVHGIDRDPVAVDVTRTALVLWAAAAGVAGDQLVGLAEIVGGHVVTGDALRSRWPGEGGLDVVVGNPPFGGQLARSTARDTDAASLARELLGGSAGYADTAGLFLVRAAEAVAPGGRVVLVQPLSFLGTRDAGVVRRHLEARSMLESVWLADERLFGAAVDVCAPVLTAHGPSGSPEAAGPVLVRRGGDGAVVAEVARDRLARSGTWAPVVAAGAGVPQVEVSGREVLGDRARATAGFRDEFYALAPFVVDLVESGAVGPGGDGVEPTDGAEPGPLPQLPAGHARLVTAGLVEPARTVWGRRTTRLAGRRLQAPAVDVLALRARSAEPDGDRRLAAWADARLRPKVVVATQTRVVEAAVDDDGSWWPSVPVITVVIDADRDDDEHRWLLAAALSAPPVSAWAAERTGGTALNPQALKLSARQVMEVPLPIDRDAWAEGARLLREVAPAPSDEERARCLAAAGRVLTDAHGLSAVGAAEVFRWWAGRVGCAGDI